MYQVDEQVVAFICEYMNQSQPKSLIWIAAACGETCESAELLDFDESNFRLQTCRADQSQHQLEFPWPAKLRERSDIRRFLMELEEDGRFSKPLESSNND